MASESRYQENYHFATSHPEAVAREMARLDDEIATLRAENERLRTALVVWENAYKTGRNEPLVQAYEHSTSLRAALQQEPKP